jgi:predicted PurR-regulated permease PerM
MVLKCIFPKLTSFHQKLACTGAGVLFTGSVFTSIYYGVQYVNWQNIELNLLNSKISNNDDNKIKPHVYKNKPYYKINPYIDKINPYIDKINPYIDKINPYIDKIKPYILQISDKFVKCIGGIILFTCGTFFTFVLPLTFGYSMYNDIKKFIEMFKSTDQCCKLIRNAGIKTITYPILCGLIITSPIIGCMTYQSLYQFIKK